jgi:hypothetical protein
LGGVIVHLPQRSPETARADTQLNYPKPTNVDYVGGEIIEREPIASRWRLGVRTGRDAADRT